jgi:hypothetical protein
MSKLEFDSGMEIVRAALGSGKTITRPLTADLRLKDVIENNEHRESFLRNVHALVAARGYKIESNQIPSELEHTIGHIAERIAYCALPGDSGLIDPAHKPRPAEQPKPKEDPAPAKKRAI